MHGQMSLQVTRLREALGTLGACVRFLARVSSLVLLQCRRITKASRTMAALVILLACVHPKVNYRIRCIIEILHLNYLQKDNIELKSSK
jgi:hypothetical protein